MFEDEIFEEVVEEYEPIPGNKHYILLNGSDIIDGWSDGPHPNKDISKAICINENGGYQFRLLFPNNVESEENPLLIDRDGLAIYKYEDGQIVPKTKAELNIARTIQENRNLPAIKSKLIAATKVELANYLSSHPLTWTDGKKYSVTQEKQALLTEQLALYSLDPQMKLYWNASGEPCATWSISYLSQLAKDIANYVRPLVQYQQHKESEINAAETAEEARSILVDYSSIS